MIYNMCVIALMSESCYCGKVEQNLHFVCNLCLKVMSKRVSETQWRGRKVKKSESLLTEESNDCFCSLCLVSDRNNF